MRTSKFLFIFITLLFAVILFYSYTNTSNSGSVEGVIEDFESDTTNDTMIYFFDLRERETFIQLTRTNFDSDPDIDDDDDVFDITQNTRVHIQIFNLSNDCNENNFFDVYTPNDTHVYNMRDIQTNDGSPSGVVLPDGAYGFVFAYAVEADGDLESDADIFIGSLRILDNNGYEYRSNAAGEPNGDLPDSEDIDTAFFNFNTLGDVSWSDIIGIAFDDNEGDPREVSLSPLDNFVVLDVDIYDLNEVPFSCRNVIYSCITPDSPLYESLLEAAGDDDDDSLDDDDDSANVAAAEYGINNAIPNTKGGELLCPGNVISDGFATLRTVNRSNNIDTQLVMYIGLNNGNGRGSMDSFWYENPCTEEDCEFDDAPT